MTTVLITVSPEASRQMRPPRALYPKDFAMTELQKRVLRDALSLIKEPPRPGEVIERDYPEYATTP